MNYYNELEDLFYAELSKLDYTIFFNNVPSKLAGVNTFLEPSIIESDNRQISGGAYQDKFYCRSSGLFLIGIYSQEGDKQTVQEIITALISKFALKRIGGNLITDSPRINDLGIQKNGYYLTTINFSYQFTYEFNA